MRCASRAIGERVGALALILTASSCGVLAPLEGTPPCADYAAVVQPVLTANCVGCHGAADAGAGYRLDSRDAGITLRDDGTSRVAGASPALLAAAGGTLAGHPAVTVSAADQEVLATWVTACKAGPGPTLFHQRGWGTPGQDAFHGAALRATGYQLESCQECHGADFAGGTSQVSCQTCHGAQVLACQTCHGSAANAAPPKSLSSGRLTSQLGVGAHQRHVTDGPLHKAYGCDACHVAVTDVHQASHFPQDGGAPDGIAEVQLAGSGATWNRATAKCGNSACHGPATPVWTTVDGTQATCGSCHGVPPAAPHPQDTACVRCHPANPADGGVLAATHVDGTVQLGHAAADGGASAACDSCHAAGAPFYDALGRTNSSVPSVGIHDIHLRGARRWSRSLGCADCHLVPATVAAAGHLDSVAPAEVFPVGSSALARADGAQPAYTASATTCANIYCHGAGTKAATDTSPTRVQTWPWTYGIGLVCTSCHGAPPVNAVHASVDAGAGLTSCSRCHGLSIDATGALLQTLPDGGVGMNHLNGVVDFNAP